MRKRAGVVFAVFLVAIPFVARSLLSYALLLAVVSLAGGLAIGRRSATWLSFITLAIYGLLLALAQVYLFRVRPHSRPHFLRGAAVLLGLAVLSAAVTELGVRLRTAHSA